MEARQKVESPSRSSSCEDGAEEKMIKVFAALNDEIAASKRRSPI